MNCPSCGTRTSTSQRNCPNCGRNLIGRGGSRTGAEAAPSGRTNHGLSPSTAKATVPGGEVPKTAGQKPSRRNKKKQRMQSVPEIPLETPDQNFDSRSMPKPGDSQIRALLHDRPDCLEDGLSIYTNANTEPVGIDFATEVGKIDLLARDDAGGLVVVLVAQETSPDMSATGKDLVGEALERVGWVRKHVAEPRQEVRAIVLLDRVPDDISYSAAAVASTVAFKTYRMEINFSDVDL